MYTATKVLLSLLLVFSFQSSNAADLVDFVKNLKVSPHDTATLDQTANAKLFDKYCVGDANSAEIPSPRYTDSLVAGAAAKLSSTKLTADTILRKVAEKEMEGYIKEAKEAADLLAKSSNAEVAKIGAQ